MRFFLHAASTLLLCLALLAPGAQAAQRHGDAPLSTQWAGFRLAPQARAQAGTDAPRLAVLFLEPDAGWYTYSRNPGGFGKPTRLSASLAGGASLETRYPPGTPKQDALDPTQNIYAYLGRTPLFVPVPGDAQKKAPISAELELLLCTKERCLPTLLSLSFELQGAASLPEASTQPWWPVFLASNTGGPDSAFPAAPPASTGTSPAGPGQWKHLRPQYVSPSMEVGGLAKAVLFGLLAGFVLNFMPCALPVISIKLSSLLAGGDGDSEAERRSRVRGHFLFLALGALLYFLILTVLFVATDLAWGQLFQKPELVLALCVVVFALGLSLLGVFSLPVIDLKFDRMTTHPKLQSLFTGMLTTLLATPCSGPFLGGVLGWALIQPPMVLGTVLMSIGLGMASPYLLLCVFPSLVRFTPKPGPWTAHVERLVALFLMGTCIYLLNILPETMVVPALVLLLVTAVASWITGQAGPGLRPLRVLLPKVLALLLVLACAWWVTLPGPKSSWEPYTDNALREKLGRELVLVDFTADWCPTCKVLEQTNLTPARMAALKETYGVRLLKADLTERNPEAEALLAALGSKSIPLLAVFSRSRPDEPIVLRDLFTPSQLEDAVAKAARQ